MAGYTAIEDAGDTLVGLLRDRMSALLDTEEIALASPDSVGKNDKIRLSLYLYRVTESAHLKNQRRRSVDATTTAGSPLELDLHYVLTAHPSQTGNDETAKSGEQHRVLGRAMQVLHDDAIVRGSDLAGSLTGEPLHLSIESEPPGSVVNVWSTFDEKPFRPSVTYVVGPVAIESGREEEVPRVVESTGESHSAVGEGPGDG